MGVRGWGVRTWFLPMWAVVFGVIVGKFGLTCFWVCLLSLSIFLSFPPLSPPPPPPPPFSVNTVCAPTVRKDRNALILTYRRGCNSICCVCVSMCIICQVYFVFFYFPWAMTDLRVFVMPRKCSGKSLSSWLLFTLRRAVYSPHRVDHI